MRGLDKIEEKYCQQYEEGPPYVYGGLMVVKELVRSREYIRYIVSKTRGFTWHICHGRRVVRRGGDLAYIVGRGVVIGQGWI